MKIETIKTLWSENELKQNTYVVIGDSSCVVIDAGCPLAKIREITDKPIEAVFITHGHYDHIEYIEEYDKLGVPIFCCYLTENFLNDSILNVSELLATPITYKVKNLHLLKDNDEIPLFDGTVKCIHTPGHTIDSMCYLFFDEFLFSGDTVFSIAVGRTDLKSGSREQLVESLNRIDKLNYNNLYPGHGRATNKEEQKENITNWIKRLS